MKQIGHGRLTVGTMSSVCPFLFGSSLSLMPTLHDVPWHGPESTGPSNPGLTPLTLLARINLSFNIFSSAFLSQAQKDDKHTVSHPTFRLEIILISQDLSKLFQLYCFKVDEIGLPFLASSCPWGHHRVSKVISPWSFCLLTDVGTSLCNLTWQKWRKPPLGTLGQSSSLKITDVR